MGESSGTNDHTSPWASPGSPPEQPRDQGYGAASHYPESQRPYGTPPDGAPAQGTVGPSPGIYTFPALEKQPLEALAAASLATSPISPLGLGLGIAALRRIRKNHRRGKGLAVGGIILSSLFLAGAVLVLATFALDGTFARMAEQPVAGDVESTRTASPVNLDVGNCVITLPVTGQVGEVTLTPCAQEHQLQVIDRLAVGDGDYPGADALFAEAEDSCAEAFNELSPAVDSWPSSFSPWHLVPSQDNWSAGEHHIVCFARSTAGPVTVDLLGGQE